jgi:hypothetical protein
MRPRGKRPKWNEVPKIFDSIESLGGLNLPPKPLTIPFFSQFPGFLHQPAHPAGLQHPYNKGMRCRLSLLLPALLLLMLARPGFSGDAPAFDLAGPKIDVHVQRRGETLPIAQAPDLRPGDRLWIHPDLPESQSAHYILIVAFLRGATNPPPPEWFHRVDTWNRDVRQEGVFVVVPDEAQQAILFLAPETGGDFSTLRAAVRGRPGAFVRATQDLQQASWDRLRLDAYLAQLKIATAGDPKLLKEHTALAARSLGIRVDQQCFDKPTEQQAPCLVQHTDGMVLDDSNVQTLVAQMANGNTADMMNQLSYSPLAGAGQFSPYVGAMVDIARILASLHTAKYQYIPALALPQVQQQDTLNLRLNVPPSFRDPKSVIVVALPPIVPTTTAAPDASHLPQLRPVDPSQDYCATKPALALEAEGAPLVFATPMARDLVLHLDTKAHLPAPAPTEPTELHPALPVAPPTPPESGIDVALKPDPILGGFVLEKPLPDLPEKEVVAQLRGKWGFDPWEGPRFHLRAPHPGGWTISAADRNALITGREDALHIQGESTLCVADVQARIPRQPADPKPVKLSWKSPKPGLLDLAVPLKEAEPGDVTIAIHQYGLEKPEELSLKAYAEAASLDRLTVSAGDKVAFLKGKRLDEVHSVDLAGITFAPAALNRVNDFDQLELSATGVTATLQPGNSYSAKVTLRDGRDLQVPAVVTPPRPQVELLSKGIQHEEPDDPNAAPPPVHLGSANDLPLQRKLVFFLRSRVPALFPRTEKIELAAVDSSFSTTLTLADGSLMLEDAHTAVAVLDPLTRFGSSAFGPVQLRAVAADGTTGDWVQLGTLVRLPQFSPAAALHCPRSPAKPCSLTGTNLFLLNSIGASQDMSDAQGIPPEFTGNTLTVPNLVKAGKNGPGETLYFTLRDDPDTVQTLTLPVVPPASSQSAWNTGAIPVAASSDAAQPAPAPPAPAQPTPAQVLPAPASPTQTSPTQTSPAQTSPEKTSPEKSSPARIGPQPPNR